MIFLRQVCRSEVATPTAAQVPSVVCFCLFVPVRVPAPSAPRLRPPARRPSQAQRLQHACGPPTHPHRRRFPSSCPPGVPRTWPALPLAHTTPPPPSASPVAPSRSCGTPRARSTPPVPPTAPCRKTISSGRNGGSSRLWLKMFPSPAMPQPGPRSGSRIVTHSHRPRSRPSSSIWSHSCFSVTLA